MVYCTFFHPKDTELTKWEGLVSFLQRSKAIDAVNNHLIDNYDYKPLNPQVVGRKLWRSLIKLISLNRRHGYYIARSLVEDNMLISSLYGSFCTKEPIF